jgi:hypothetical protein
MAIHRDKGAGCRLLALEVRVATGEPDFSPPDPAAASFRGDSGFLHHHPIRQPVAGERYLVQGKLRKIRVHGF